MEETQPGGKLMPDDNPELMTIFGEALERTNSSARAAYLDEACKGNLILRRRVEALLAAHDGAGRFLEPDSCVMSETTTPETEEAARASGPEPCPPSHLPTEERQAAAAVTTIADPEAGDRRCELVAGQVIAGRYRLLDILGEGGMGTVYRADQTQPVKRPVALKLIKVGMDSRAVLARFDAERQALALMDHPNIARVYDGGTTAAGQPFFVMELVSGVPITEYCDRQRRPVRARLELFVAVCQAVQHAHQKGIIHRDLKPGNVLVTEVDGRPTPKVIDFGVARATDFKLTDLSLVDTGAIVGTPAYMSPEQADPSSIDIDTRTDVYALGVILYELLAGSPPIDTKQFQRGAFLEMLRMVREVEPPRPSTKVSTAAALPNIAASRDVEPAHLKQLLRGDLDWIVMKALEKDRARRYETANGFAADVLRHLAHEPVLAAPPSRAYRLRKFVRKHRGGVVAATLVVLALVVGIAGTTYGLFREAKRVKERDAAVGEARDAERSAYDRAAELRYQLGISNFLLASAAYDNRDVVGAAERLDNVHPDQRGWEWRYLKRLTRGGLFTLYGHTDRVESAAFSPDGSRIVTASWDRTAKVWDARTGAPLIGLKGHVGWLSGAAFSPDGSRIVTGSHDRTAKMWDARSGSLLLDFKGHTDRVESAAFSPDGTRVVTGSWDHTAKVWDARSGLLLLELKGHTSAVSSAAFSPDGTRIVVGIWEWPVTARVWDARTGSPLLDLKGHMGGVSSAAFSPDGTTIVTGSQDGTAKVWDARTGSPVIELKGHTREVTSAAFGPDGTRIVTGSRDRTAKVWDARTGTPMLELKSHTRGGISAASFSPDGTRILTSGDGATVWEAAAVKPLRELKRHRSEVRSASFSADSTRIITTSVDNTARVWDVQTGAALLELKGHTSGFTNASFSSDGRRIVTASFDGSANLWDALSGSPLFELKGHTSLVWSAVFSLDGARIVTCSHDCTAKVWDALSGSLQLELKGHSRSVRSAAFSRDGTRVVTWCDDQTAKVWDARTGEELKSEPIPPTFRPGAISPDGRLIAYLVGNRVELIPLQPDADELAYRWDLMRPNFRLYREAYDAAVKANDTFAARFYLNLFLPPERALIQAERIVGPLFARLLVRDDVISALKARPAADADVQAACLKLAATWPESASTLALRAAAWELIAAPGQADANYQRGLRLAKAAHRLRPESAEILNIQGVAQYRCGLIAEALATLTRSNALRKGKEPSDLTFLALAQHRLGLTDKAGETLARLHQVMVGRRQAENQESLAFLREAETIELDRVFPADPFAP
jgi:eukaryotic-like serine/threonine-protein kinase